MEPVYKVRVSRNYGTVMIPGYSYTRRGPQMHQLIQPAALAWLTQRVGKRAKTRAAFDCHGKFRWWYCLPQPSMDNTREGVSWQARSVDRHRLEQAEFWFKDAHLAMLFRLSFT